MSSTLGFRPEGSPDENTSSAHSPVINNIPLSAPKIVPVKDFPSHITLPMINQWRLWESERFSNLARNCGGRELPLDKYQINSDFALDLFERRAAFLAGEVYERVVLDKRLLVRSNAGEILCSQLVHYAPQDCPTLSLFVSDEKVEYVCLFPFLTRVESSFSSAGGAQKWEFSRNDASPFLPRAAYLHALDELERFDGVTVDFDRRIELPLMLRLAVERSRGPLPKSLYPDENRQIDVSVQRENMVAQISLRSGRIGIHLACSLVHNRPLFEVLHSGQDESTGDEY